MDSKDKLLLLNNIGREIDNLDCFSTLCLPWAMAKNIEDSYRMGVRDARDAIRRFIREKIVGIVNEEVGERIL